MLYLVYCESANYGGYGQHFVVIADNEALAEQLAEQAAEDYFYEQDCEQLEQEGHDFEGMSFAVVVSVELFDDTHRSWKFYQDPSQREFYTEVNL